MKECLSKEDINKVDGILFDIGVSSMQLDEDYRGFSYHNDAPLDMRMDTDSKLSAYNVVNEYEYADLVRVLRDYGEEKWSSRIAEFIVAEREKKPIETTFELVDIIKAAVPAGAREEKGHPAKRVFQAIRIYVNEEISELENAVRNAIDSLNVGGRLCIITFHSLEDRIVKEVFNEEAKSCICPPDFPTCVCGKKSSIKLVNRKPILPTDEELEINLRAHSAKLRVAEKI
jgi:16S rRNA (cytosine1402-N4)-methyltransferase